MYAIFMRSIGKGLVYLCLLAGLAGVVLFVLVFHFWIFLRLPGSPSRDIREVTIPSGSSAESIAGALHSKGIVSDSRLFTVLCWLRKSSHKLKAGEYAFSVLSTPDQIMDQLTTGKVLVHKVTFPEGTTLRDVARILQEKGLAPHEDVIRLSADGDYIQSLGLTVSTLEGYLFPETYYFQRTQSGGSILKAMVDQFKGRLPEGWEDRAREVGLTLHEIVIMASMVEKEAVVDRERPIIAAVFFNRMKLKMPLQSDPTAVYDLPGFSGPIESFHLKRQSPYNTYVVRGLPVGPICNPGVKSLRAVLFPEAVPYLYFVSNDDGTHQFSETVTEHHRAVSRYHERRKAREERENRVTEEKAPPVDLKPQKAGQGRTKKAR